MSDGFWDWAVRVYADKEVSELCLELQDDHDHCVPLLLWALWLGAGGVKLGAETADEAAEVARAYHDHVISPLRGLRRKLKSAISDIEDAHRLSLREDIKAVELKSEAALMQALEALVARPEGSPALSEASMSANLITMARVWNPVVVRTCLMALHAAILRAANPLRA